MRLNPPAISIRITKQDLGELLLYCNKCNSLGFVNTNEYTRTEPTREALLKCHLYSVTEKIMDKLYKHHTDRPNKLVNIKFNQWERIAFSVFFKRVHVPGSLTTIEYEIINQLTI